MGDVIIFMLNKFFFLLRFDKTFAHNLFLQLIFFSSIISSGLDNDTRIWDLHFGFL